MNQLGLVGDAWAMLSANLAGCMCMVQGDRTQRLFDAIVDAADSSLPGRRGIPRDSG